MTRHQAKKGLHRSNNRGLRKDLSLVTFTAGTLIPFLNLSFGQNSKQVESKHESPPVPRALKTIQKTNRLKPEKKSKKIPQKIQEEVIKKHVQEKRQLSHNASIATDDEAAAGAGDWIVVKRKRVHANQALARKKKKMNVVEEYEKGQTFYQEKIKADDFVLCRYCKHKRPPVDYQHPLYSSSGEIVCPKFGSCFICNSKSHTPKYCVYNPVLRGLVVKIYEAGPGALKDSVIREIRRQLLVSIPCRFCLKHSDGAFNHALKDEAGNVVCPVLYGMRCSVCGATGPNSHTAKYCPHRRP